MIIAMVIITILLRLFLSVGAYGATKEVKELDIDMRTAAWTCLHF